MYNIDNINGMDSMEQILAYLKQNGQDIKPDINGEELRQQITGKGLQEPTWKAPPIPPSEYEVKTSDTTVPMQGKMPDIGITASIPPVPSVDFNPVTANSLPNDTAPAVPSAAKPMVPPAPEPTADKNTTENILSSTAQDEETRKAGLAELERKRKLGIIPQALAGIGDAISASASAFGGNAPGGSLERLVNRQEKEQELGKKELEARINEDPNSDVSKAYRQMVLQIAPELGKQPAFQNMSAKMIGDKLPMIDAMMKAQAQKDTKEMSLAALKENRANAQQQKDLALSEKEDQFNQRRWERFGAAIDPMSAGSRRALGVAAVNNMRADRLLATSRNKTVTSQDYSNIIADLQGIYKGGVPDQEMMRHGDYPSIQRKAGQILSMLSGNPAAIKTPELMAHLTTLAKELKDIDNKVINDNLGFNSVIFDELKKADPAKFQRAMESLSAMTVGVADEPKAPVKGTVQPTGPRKTKSGISYSVEE